jgi:hypothetical protein
MSNYQQMIDELTAEFHERRAKTTELHRKMKEITATATAPRSTVKVSVGAQGEIRGIEFPTGAYKRMTPTELSAALLETIGEAKQKALTMLRELIEPEMPEGSSGLLDVITGKSELPDVLPDGPVMPDAVRQYLMNGRPGEGDGA